MLVNSNTFNIKSTITDDWGGSHRLVLDLEALSSVEDWKFEISLPNNYQIDQIYSGQVTQEGGKTYISGVNWNESLNQGDNTEIVLIIDEGNSSAQDPIATQFIFADSTNSTPINSNLITNSQIVEDWYGGYKLEVEITAESQANDWRLNFDLPYDISAIYGAELITHGNGSYSIDGLNNQVNLYQGQSIKPIFIIQDGGNQAIAPSFSNLNTETPKTVVNKVENEVITTDEIISPDNNNNDNIINVDYEFGGNLESAIAAANDGDIVQLGGNIYYTDGITIDKDITLQGQTGSVINGRNTLEPIINLSSGASGATIQNLEITNGDTGIYGYSVFDLTLQNLNINNIGLNKTIRDGQNNTGIVLNRANGLKLLDSSISDVSRKGVGVNDTDGALISGLSIQNINLTAQHSQSFDAAGIKFFNTNDVTVKNSYFSDSNAMSIWNDTTNATTIEGNTIVNVGEDFLKPNFDNNTDISGIYNEKSVNAIIINNEATAIGRYLAFNATEFSTPTMTLMGNNFSSFAVNTQDYWVNEEAEKRIAITEDPDEANFSLFEDEYFAVANIG